MSDPNEPFPPAPSAPSGSLLSPALSSTPSSPTLPQEAVLPEPVPSTPYRVLSPPIEPPADAPPQLDATPLGPRPRPLLGPALSVFGMLLWAFVVAGQFTTSWMFGTPLGQGTAVSAVLVTTFAMWIASLRRSRIVAPPRRSTHLFWRAVGVSVIAFLMFVVCLLGATFAGAVASRNHDLAIAVTLVIISTSAAIAGARLTSPTAPERTHGQRFALVAAWIAGALLTLMAGADLAANG